LEKFLITYLPYKSCFRQSVLSDTTCSIALSLSKWEFNDLSGWVKLLLCLMFEYTSKTSKWKPYMNFLPSVKCIDQPMFWSQSERATLLKGTGNKIAVFVS